MARSNTRGLVCVGVAAAFALLASHSFVPSARGTRTQLRASKDPMMDEPYEPGKFERDGRIDKLSEGRPRGEAYGQGLNKDQVGKGIRTGLSDLLKPLNSQAGVTAKEDQPATLLVMVTGILLLFLFYVFLLLVNNGTVLLPPEDEFDEYVKNFWGEHFFGDN